MVVEMSMNTICGHTTKIKAKKDGESIRVNINTTCKRIQNICGEEFIITKNELLDKSSNPVIEKMKKETACFVPSAVMTACRLEEGSISKNLAKSIGKMEVTFDKVE